MIMRFVPIKTLGLTPQSHSNGGKQRLGRIPKMASPEFRPLLVARERPSCGFSEPALGRAVAEGASCQTAL